MKAGGVGTVELGRRGIIEKGGNRERPEPCERGKTFSVAKEHTERKRMKLHCSSFALFQFFRGHHAALFNFFSPSRFWLRARLRIQKLRRDAA
jgi:hypothetical protein